MEIDRQHRMKSIETSSRLFLLLFSLYHVPVSPLCVACGGILFHAPALLTKSDEACKPSAGGFSNVLFTR